jgi:hypothetical protein
MASKSTSVPTNNLDSAFRIYEVTQEHIRFADAKAAFVFGIDALLLGFIPSVGPSLTRVMEMDPTPIAACFAVAGLAIFAAAGVVSIGFLMWAVISRFGRDAPRSIIFFGHIANDYGKDFGKYVSDLSAMTDDKWLSTVGSQIVETSHIANDKHFTCTLHLAPRR